MARFDVFGTDKPEQPQKLLGQAEVDDGGRLKLLHAEPGAQAALDRAFADLNGREGLVLKLPPGPDDPKFAIIKKTVPRDDPQFFEAIQDNLHRWHSMSLSPTA